MYVGHVAVALALKTREPRVPMVPLILACYGPDWLETFLGFWHGRAQMGPYTHYLPGLFAGALAAAAIYVIVFRRPGGWIILSAWLLHWPADFFTAYKGLLSPTDRVGLDLYDLPLADFVLESVIVLICCAWYARTFAHSPLQRRWVIAMAAALVGLQALLDYGLSQDDAPWNPSLASHEWRPHLTSLAPDAVGTAARMPLALVPGTSTTSARWPAIECVG